MRRYATINMRYIIELQKSAGILQLDKEGFTKIESPTSLQPGGLEEGQVIGYLDPVTGTAKFVASDIRNVPQGVDILGVFEEKEIPGGGAELAPTVIDPATQQLQDNLTDI